MNNNNDVYVHSLETARQNDEFEQYRESHRMNIACAKAIKKAIYDNNLGDYRYDMKNAVNTVIARYGMERMNYVLANTLQNNDHDGRFTRSNKEWAKAFSVPQETLNYEFDVTAHHALIDGFVSEARKACAILHKEQKQEKPSVLGQMNDKASSVQSTGIKNALKNKNEIDM